MLRLAVNVAVFGAFLLMVLVFGFFLWQTLFASEEHSNGEAQGKPAYSEQQSSNENTFGASVSPSANKASTDEAIASYTRWLAIFTMFLVLATVGLFISGERNVEVSNQSASAARAAADAANESVKIAARQFESAFKPWLAVKISGAFTDPHALNMFKDGDQPRWTPINVRIEVKNLVEMPATIVFSDVWAMKSDNEPDDAGRRIERGTSFKYWVVIGKGEKFFPGWASHRLLMETNPDQTVNFGSFRLTKENRDYFFRYPPVIVGRIEYLDPLQKRRLLGFAFKPHTLDGREYSRWGGEKYNYDREISETIAPPDASEIPY